MSDPACINDLSSLEALLDQEPIVVRWTVYPHEPATVWLAPSTLQLSAAGNSIADSAFSHQFRQFLSNTLGLASHTRGATLIAVGSITLTREHGERAIEIAVEYSESSADEGSISSGFSNTSTSLDDFTMFLQNCG